ncbi:MAG: MBL fold metallo-hydrolase [Bacteroidales bacterium]|nr:MBL fold metallo-hydrolase [Bacteroidales bacterium]
MVLACSIIFMVAVAAFVGFMQQKKFGKLPAGDRMLRIQLSPNYKDGAFQNEHHTPVMTEGVSFFSALKEFFFAKGRTPVKEIPSMKTDLRSLDPATDVLVWFGHSSYFMQIGGKTFLVDPVFSGSASPVAFTTRAFAGSDRYSTADLPYIDVLFITHDHWDHLDFETVTALRTKTSQVICPIGVGEHLMYWGFGSEQVIELDWHDSVSLKDGISVYAKPARHFSGRGFTRNQSLWASFVLQTPQGKIFIGGDSGYDTHFAAIGNEFGPFDLAILENGQYDKSWKYIHMMPAEVLQAACDLKAKRILPVHSSKFALANHAWDTPLKTITAISKQNRIGVVTPMIGEAVLLNETSQIFSKWWEK